MYDQIWSDQPPIFTYLLAGLFRITGPTVNPARFLVLLLSLLLIWAVIQFLREVWGNWHALSGLVLLLLLPTFATLSVAALVGLPALSFAMQALLFLVYWHLYRKKLWLIISALLLSLSIFTKVFTAILVPVFLVGLLISEYHQNYQRDTKGWINTLLPAVWWGFVFGLTCLLISFLLVGYSNFDQLIEPHISAVDVYAFRNDFTLTINYHLRRSIATLVMALLGTIYMLLSKRWLTLYPLAWMVVAYLFLVRHSPVWSHQMVLVTLPAAMLASIALGETLFKLPGTIRSRSFRSRSGLLSLASILIFAILLVVQIPPLAKQLSLQNPFVPQSLHVTVSEEIFLAKMIKRAPETKWVITDLPIYPFRANLLVPPHLAVISAKRMETGNLTEQDLIDNVQEWKPEQILMARFDLTEFNQFLKQDYRVIQTFPRSSPGGTLYLRKTLIDDSSQQN